MNILLLGINARYTHSNLAIRYLCREITQAGHRAVIKEYSINDKYLAVLGEIACEQYDAVLCSVYIWNTPFFERLIPDIKKVLPKTLLIAGGPEVSYNAERWISAYPMIDAIICGAGEEAVRQLSLQEFSFSALNTKTRLINGTQHIISVPNRDFCDIPLPYTESDLQTLSGKYLYYESARGCSFACSYCLSSRSDQKTEYKEYDAVSQELNGLLKWNPMKIKFVDRTFNSDPVRARKIWDFCIRSDADTVFHFEIHPSLLCDEDFDFLAQIPRNKFQFEIGIQTIHENVLKEIGRSGNWKKQQENIIRLINSTEIPVHCDMIAGLPFEGMDHISDTFNAIARMHPSHFQMGFLKILPGTRMSEKAESYGMRYTEKAPYEILSSNWLSIDQLNELRKIEQLAESVYNSGIYKKYIPLLEDGSDYFQFFRQLLRYSENNCFDITTKNRNKLEVLLDAFFKN